MDSIARSLVLAVEPRVVRRALITSLVVGTILTLVHDGPEIVGRGLAVEMLWPVALTFLAPYVVATISSASAIGATGAVTGLATHGTIARPDGRTTPPARDECDTPDKPGRLPILAIVGTAAFVAAAFALMLWLTSDPVRRETVEGLVRSPIGLVVLFGLAALSTATLILPAPGLALTAIAGASGDPFVVGIVAGLGQAAGELTGYAAGWSGRSLLPDNPATRRLTEWLKRRGLVVIFVLAVIPNPLFDLAGIAAGALRVPVFRYLGAAAAGKVIKNIVVAAGAATIRDLLSGFAGGGF